MKPVLLDTGPVVALLDRSEKNHARCVEAISGIDGPLITCEAVISESCYLLRDVLGAPEAILENVERGVFLVPFRLSGASGRLARLMRKYSQVPMDLADACLVAMAEDHGTGRILTLDHDFQVYRWSGKKRFEDLLATG